MDHERYWFEGVPEEQRYYFLTQWGKPRIEEEQGIGKQVSREREIIRREEDVGYASIALDPPFWSDVDNRWEHRAGPEYVTAPQLYTTRGRAEEELRQITDNEPAALLELVKRYEWADVNDALDNTAPLRVVWVDKESLVDKLRDADFLCVRVDERLKLREDFIEELDSRPV